MSQQIEALSLGDAPNTVVVKLHPTVVFSVLNNYVRRSDRETRVIGTLLGTITDGCIEITECFGVPHMEKKDELFVAINKDYHKTMYNFHRRINRKEKIVGWYTTTSSEGALINDNSSLIHDFYSQECEHPVHIVVDTTLAGNNKTLNHLMTMFKQQYNTHRPIDTSYTILLPHMPPLPLTSP